VNINIPEPVFRANVEAQSWDNSYRSWFFVCTIEVGGVEIFKRYYTDSYGSTGTQYTSMGEEIMVAGIVYSEREALEQLLTDFGNSLKLKIGD
jgi:hypothetical protein